MSIRNQRQFLGVLNGPAGADVDDAPTVELSLSPENKVSTDGSVQSQSTVIIRATWGQSINSMPEGVIHWSTTSGESGVTKPSLIESVGSSAVWDITIPLPENGRGRLTYVVQQHSAVSLYPTDTDDDGSDDDDMDDSGSGSPSERTPEPNKVYPTGPAEPIEIIVVYLTEIPTVEIIVASEAPVDEDQPIRDNEIEIEFRWKPVGGEASSSVNVDGFGDEVADIGVTNAAIKPASFEEITQSRYRVVVVVPNNEETTIAITVPEDSAFRVDSPDVKGPPDDVSETFTVNTANPIDETVTNGTTIKSDEFTFAAHNLLNSVLTADERGGAFLNGSDMIPRGNYVYYVDHVRRKIPVSNINRLSDFSESGSVLQRLHLDTGVCTALRTYKRSSTGARSLALWKNEIYFFEGSAYSSQNEKSDETAHMGHLYKIDTSDNIVDLGIVRKSRKNNNTETEYKHNKTISPLVPTNDGLMMIAGYGELEAMHFVEEGQGANEAEEAEKMSESKLITNWQMIEYRDTLSHRIPLLETNSKTGYEIIKSMSQLSQSVFGMKNNTGFYIPRDPLTAKVSSFAAGPPGYIVYKDETLDVPITGHVLIGQSLIKYTSTQSAIDDTKTLHAIERGIFDTASSGSIGPNDKIIFIDHYLDVNEGIVEDPINDFKIEISPHRFNIVRIRYDNQNKIIERKNQASINLYKELPFELSVPLSQHDTAWVQDIADKLLNRFSQIRYRVTLILKSSFYLQLGDAVLIRETESHFFYPIQIVSISNKESDLTTTIIGETF